MHILLCLANKGCVDSLLGIQLHCPEDYIDTKSPVPPDLQQPDCTKVLDLPYSIHAFQHLRNSSSWVLYNMASFYWRIKNEPYQVVECAMRALHFSSRQNKDIALVNLANILHRAHFSADAAIVVHAALDYSDFFTSYYTLGNIYAMLGEYNHSVLCYDHALQAKPGFEQAVKRKHAVLCQQKLEQKLEAQHRVQPILSIPRDTIEHGESQAPDCSSITDARNNESLNILVKELDSNLDLKFKMPDDQARQPEDPLWLVLNEAGLYWRAVGNSTFAITCLQKAFNLAPHEYQDIPLVNLANLLIHYGLHLDASRLLLKALAINASEVRRWLFVFVQQ
ncbi:tetratricopeptide repeat protein hypothetical protein [Limosa lapponica baueri]|uniref:Tetratricopeptide repeat protein 17 n=1 Tax=Limosa lapponica baueri TaxID=1758121 RepID=A0A2I0T8B3_LIMLA|nr:tetratricopeptide repeat protein hypothetical protein [Limosa lapponica baueri]